MLFLPKAENGNARFTDLSYMNPYGLYHTPLMAFGRALTARDPDEALWPATVTGFMELTKPLYSPQLWAQTAIDIFSNKDSSSGEKIWGGVKTPEQSAAAIAGQNLAVCLPLEHLNQ